MSRERILEIAIDIADNHGLSSVSMRKIAAELGVEAMSLYHHVANKDEIFNGMVDVVLGEMALPSSEIGWRAALRHRSISAREVLSRHHWALALVESRRKPGPATLKHHDALLKCLRSSGFSVAMTARTVSLIDSYIYGFVLQEQNMQLDTPDEVRETVGTVLQHMSAEKYPHLTELIKEHVMKPGYAYRNEFENGLDMILDAIEEHLAKIKL